MKTLFVNPLELLGLLNAAHPVPDVNKPIKRFHLRPCELPPQGQLSFSCGPREALGPGLLVGGKAFQCDYPAHQLFSVRVRRNKEMLLDVRSGEAKLLRLSTLTSRQLTWLGVAAAQGGFQLSPTLPVSETPAAAVAAYWDELHSGERSLYAEAASDPWVWLLPLTSHPRTPAADAGALLAQLARRRRQQLDMEQAIRRAVRSAQDDACKAKCSRLDTDEAILHLLQQHPDLQAQLSSLALELHREQLSDLPPAPDPQQPSLSYRDLMRDAEYQVQQYQRSAGPVQAGDVPLVTRQLNVLQASWPRFEVLYFENRHWLSVPDVEPLDEQAVKVLEHAEYHRRARLLRAEFTQLLEAEVRRCTSLN